MSISLSIDYVDREEEQIVSILFRSGMSYYFGDSGITKEAMKSVRYREGSRWLKLRIDTPEERGAIDTDMIWLNVAYNLPASAIKKLQGMTSDMPPLEPSSARGEFTIEVGSILSFEDGYLPAVLREIVRVVQDTFGDVYFDCNNKNNSKNMFKVVQDFYVKNVNLKEKEFKVIQSKKGSDGEVYVLADFEEDIGGSCLDGNQNLRSCAFIPYSITQEVNKEKGGQAVAVNQEKGDMIKLKGKTIASKSL